MKVPARLPPPLLLLASLPPPPALGPAPPTTATPLTVTVQRGDTLRTIAARLLGSPERSGEIYALNRDILTSPDHIEAGQKLRLPR